MVALSATVLAVSVWLPWLTTAAHGGGHANAAGGSVGALELPQRFGAGQAIVLLSSALLVAGAMAGRGLAPGWASAAALLISGGIAALTAWYYQLHVTGEVSPSYGWYLGAAAATGAVACSAWALIDAFRHRRRVR